MGAMGQVNPLLKAPVEFATNKQFFSGRDLSDLYSQTGNRIADSVIANSPFARVATTFRTLTDERKGAMAKLVNLASGVRIQDIDMDKAKQAAVRDFVNDTLRGKEGFHKFEQIYVKPEDIPNLAPGDLELLSLLKTQAHRNRAEKQAEKTGPLRLPSLKSMLR